MHCSSLPRFLEGELPPGAQAEFEQHLVGCAACQAELEAAMQLSALGAELAERADRPHPAPRTQRPSLLAGARLWIGAAGLAAAAAIGLLVFGHWGPTPEDEIASSLLPHRPNRERLPYAPLDRYRAYDPPRAGASAASKPPADSFAHPGASAVQADSISMTALAALEKRRDTAQLVAALLAHGDLAGAESRLAQAGAGDDLDVERAIVAQRKGQAGAALGLLDRVLARSPHHPQAMWNRAVALTDLDLPLAAAEAFERSAAAAEPGWAVEAAQHRDELRQREDARSRRLVDAVAACQRLADGTLPDLEVASRYPALCRPSLLRAVRRATSRDEALRLLPIARAIDQASGDTASSELVDRIAASDFRARGPSIALYTRLITTPDLPAAEQDRIAAQLRASGPSDLALGALLELDSLRHMELPAAELAEIARLARASHDPYLDELATQYDARAKLASGEALEAELSLRQAVATCDARPVELRCAYLHIALVQLYLARHLPTEATETALVALRRSRRLDLYWDERLLFGFLAQAAQLARDYAQMRAYLREAELRVSACDQTRLAQQAIAGAELSELRFASARAELDRSPMCDQPMSRARAQIEAELVRFDGTPARVAALRTQLDRIRREVAMSPGQRAHLDAVEGRALSTTDPAAARAALGRAIAAADALGFDDVDATKARDLAYRTLLVLGADDGAPALLDRFAAAARARLRPGCALGAMIDGERLLLVARDAAGKLTRVLDPHAFQTPDFDARTVVPAGLVSALASCARVDVLALPPLYGQPQLLPPELAWSYRGPAGAAPAGARRPSVMTIEDARPPAALGLPPLRSPVHEARRPGIDEVILAGAEATPRRVRDELARTDFAEIHAHGFVDLGISDVSLIALSPDADGSFALTARTIAGLKLTRAPFVALAACDAAYTAPYLHEPWSLPYALLLAGARGVLAPATAIPDQEAGDFFRAVGDPILRGVDPAVVLRDQRLARRGGATGWVDSVVLFD